MWGETLVLLLIIFKVSSIYSPGVEVTLTGDHLRFKCRVKEYFKQSLFLNSVYNKNISSLELIDCLKKISGSSNRSVNNFSEQHLFNESALESVSIHTSEDLKIVWHKNTLDKLTSLILNFGYSFDTHKKKLESCESLSEMLQLTEFRNLRRLELIITGRKEICRQYTNNDSKL